MKFIVLENDGIGPEIMAATLPVLQKLDDRFGLNIELVPMVSGMRALKAEGKTIPDYSMVLGSPGKPPTA